MSNSIIPPEALDTLAKRYGLGKYAGTKPKNIISPVLEQGIIEDEHGFTFQNLELAPTYFETVQLNKTLLDNNQSKSQHDWWEYIKTTSDGAVLPNGIILYQMMHRAYALRDNPSYQNVVATLRELLKQDWDTACKYIGTAITYKTGLEATIEHLQLDGSVKSVDTLIPEFTKLDNNWSYLILAQKQPEDQLGHSEQIPDNAKPVLETLLGSHYEDVVPVYQYLCSRKNGNLREVRLWIPTLTNRNAKRALVFGVNGYVGGFGIDASVNVNNVRPARGVVGAKNSP